MTKKIKDPEAVKRGRSAKRKGKCGEREIVKILKEYGWNAKRGWQSRGGEDPDVISDFPYRIEVKWQNRLNIYGAFDQADKDRKEADDRKINVVVFRKNDDEWRAAINLYEFLALVKIANNL